MNSDHGFASTLAIDEIHNAQENDLTQDLLTANKPVVLRGLVSHWPLVKASIQSASEGAIYLTRRANERAVQAFTGSADIDGRYFYNDDLSGFNFTAKTSTFKQVIDELFAIERQQSGLSLYLGSTSINHILPELRQENDLKSLSDAPLVSIWAGNQSRIAAHFDVPDNLACCVAGKRRFTLFPPEQWDNLYVGPLDFTPAGQPASLVDFHHPDFTRFPRFKHALEQCSVVELQPGDGIFIPSMWWHHVEGLMSFNVLVNYWWRQVPNYIGAPLDALEHAILSIRELPLAQRQQWQKIFNQYVFEQTKQDHIPDAKRGLLNPLDEDAARKLRAQLVKKLNR